MVHNRFNLFLSVALTLPRPLNEDCQNSAKKLEKAVAVAGSGEQAELTNKLEKIPAWNDWVIVHQTYGLMGGKSKSPRVLFWFWTYTLKGKIHSMHDAYIEQYHAIADAIERKAVGKQYSDIDIRALVNIFLNPEDGYDHNDSEEEEEEEVDDDDEVEEVDDEEDDDDVDVDAPSNDDVDKLQATIEVQRKTIEKLEATIQKLRAEGGQPQDHPPALTNDDNDNDDGEGEDREADDDDDDDDDDINNDNGGAFHGVDDDNDDNDEDDDDVSTISHCFLRLVC